MFLLLFKNGNIDPTRYSFDKYYVSLLEIKDFNALTDNESYFDQPVKSKQEAYGKLIEMSRNDNYTTGNLLDFSYHQNCYKLIGIDLSTQRNTNIPQQIDFAGKLEEDDGVKCFLLLKSNKKQL